MFAISHARCSRACIVCQQWGVFGGASILNIINDLLGGYVYGRDTFIYLCHKYCFFLKKMLLWHNCIICYIFCPYAPWCWKMYQHLPIKNDPKVGIWIFSIDWFKGQITGQSHDLHGKMGLVSGGSIFPSICQATDIPAPLVRIWVMFNPGGMIQKNDRGRALWFRSCCRLLRPFWVTGHGSKSMPQMERMG